MGGYGAQTVAGMSAGHGGLARAVQGRKVGHARMVAWCACRAECRAWRTRQWQGAGGISPHALHDPVPLPHSLFSVSVEAGERKQEERDDTVGASYWRREVAAACWVGPRMGEREHARRPGQHPARPARLSRSAVGAV
jgi:hypothetical protein